MSRKWHTNSACWGFFWSKSGSIQLILQHMRSANPTQEFWLSNFCSMLLEPKQLIPKIRLYIWASYFSIVIHWQFELKTLLLKGRSSLLSQTALFLSPLEEYCYYYTTIKIVSTKSQAPECLSPIWDFDIKFEPDLSHMIFQSCIQSFLNFCNPFTVQINSQTLMCNFR